MSSSQKQRIQKLFFALLLIFLCPLSASAENGSFSSLVEAAQGGAAWNDIEVLSSKINIHFGGKQRLKGKMLMNNSASKIRLELDDGTLMVFDGNKAWVTPKDAPYKKPRFDLLTWSYFLAAPFKLDDDGVNLKTLGQRKLDGKIYEAVKMTFGAGIGDSPDDWYVLYQDKETKRLTAMAYIVTYGKKSAGAENSPAKKSKPHAIVYSEFKKVNGVSIATRWKFYNWSESKGIFGEPIGDATISELEVLKDKKAFFTAPENAMEAKLP